MQVLTESEIDNVSGAGWFSTIITAVVAVFGIIQTLEGIPPVIITAGGGGGGRGGTVSNSIV